MIVPKTFRQGNIITYVLVNTSFLYAEVHRAGMPRHAACLAAPGGFEYLGQDETGGRALWPRRVPDDA